MSLRDRGLTAYDGPRRPVGAQWQVIARRSLSSAVRLRGVMVLLFLVGLGMVWTGLRVFGGVVVQGSAATGAGSLQLGSGRVLFDDYTSVHCLLITFFTTLLAASGAICDDARAFPFYFSRPVTRDAYLTGKLLGACAAVALVTLVPELVLITLVVLVRGAAGVETLKLLGPVLAVGALEILVFAAPMVAVSATLPRRSAAQAAATALFFLPWIAGALFTSVVRTPWPSLLSIPAELRAVAAWLFGVAIPPEERALPVQAAAAALALYVVGALAWSRHRLGDIARGAAE